MGTTVQEFFKEIEEHSTISEANEIIQIKAAEQKKGGLCNPITDLSSCSEEEKAIIQKALEIQLRDSLRAAGVREEALPTPVDSMTEVATQRQMTPEAWAATQALFYPTQSLFSVMEYFSQFIVSFEGEFYVNRAFFFERISEDQLRQWIFERLRPQLSSGRLKSTAITEVLRLLKDNPWIVRKFKTDDCSHVHFMNGKYCFETGTFEMPGPNEFFTCYIPINYTPEKTDCPLFRRFVSDVCGGQAALIDRIFETIGYLLVPDNRAKRFFLMYGPGNSGKSVMGNLISSLFNTDSVANLPIQRFQDKHSTSILRGKYLNLSMDLPKTGIHKDAIGTIKMITGDDVITIEAKYKDAESMRPTCRLVFGSNYPLQVRENDAAFFSRLVILPFNHPVPAERQDKTMLEHLKEERVGIVLASLQAYMGLRARGYVFSGEENVQALPTGIGSTAILLRFVHERCCLTPDGYTFTADLLRAYNCYRAKNGLAPETDLVSFSRNLATACQGRITRKKRRICGENLNGYEGISLASNDVQFPDEPA